MWSYMAVNVPRPRQSTRFRATFGLLAATCALAILAVPGIAGAAIGPVPASESSLAFGSERAHLVGSQVLVLVKCLGSQGSTCNGTLTLITSGNRHKVPFSVIGGTSQSLTVPLGADSTARRAVAVAETAQASGGYVRSSEVLHLR
jgi:hypothetical protein